MRYSALVLVLVVLGFVRLSAQNPALNITISPSTTTASNSAFTLTINGNGFVGTPRIFLGGVELQIIRTSNTVILVQVPASLNSQGNMLFVQVIQNAMGVQMGFNTALLTINSPIATPTTPVITRVTPSGLPPSGGQIVIIGTNFSTLATVRLNNTTLAIVSINSSQIIVIIPPVSFLPVGILYVTNPDGQFVSRFWGYVNNINLQNQATTLSPNPAQTTLTFTTTLDRASNLTLTLRNTLGASVLTEQHTAAAGRFSATLDISTLASGVYLLEARDDAGSRWVQKVVKY